MLSGTEGQHSNPFSTLTPTSQQHPRVNDRSPLGRRRRRRAVVAVRRAFCLLNTRSSSSLSSPPPPTSSRPPRKSARPRRSAPSAGRTADGTDDGRTDGPVAGVAVALDSTATDPSVAVVGLRADYCIGLEVGRTEHCMSVLSV